jgi:hypothetical protein
MLPGPSNSEQTPAHRTGRRVARVEPLVQTAGVESVLARSTRLGGQCAVLHRDDAVGRE